MNEVRLARTLAYIDGELSPGERAAFEAELADDPALAAQVGVHRGLAARVAGAYAPVLDEPVPVRLRLPPSAVNDRGRSRLPTWAALAASLVVGVLAGRLAMPEPDPMTVRGEIDRVLTTALASETGPVRVGVTFRDRAGHWCRTFESAPDRLAGLACRRDGRWRLQVAVAWRPAAADYRQAGSGADLAILTGVDQLRAGETLDAAAEKSARDAGWDR